MTNPILSSKQLEFCNGTTLLPNIQVLRLAEAFANGSSANIKLWKTLMHKLGQPGGYLGRLLRPLLKIGLSLMKNVLKSLAKSILIPLRLTVVASETDVTIHYKMFGFGTTTLITFNEKMNGIMKIVKSLEGSSLLMKGVSETIQNEAKKQKGGSFSMLLGALSASLLENLLIYKGTIRAD